MTTRYGVNNTLYRQNARPRQLRGYLAYCGLAGALDRIADDVSTLRAARAFESLVPPEIHGDCHIILFRDGTLSIHAGLPATASWLRNRQERLVRGFLDKRVEIGKLQLMVSPRNTHVEQRTVTELPPPPPGAADVVRQGARSIGNTELREALERLARRLERSGS